MAKNVIELTAPSGNTYRTTDRAEADHFIRTAGYVEVKPKAPASTSDDKK